MRIAVIDGQGGGIGKHLIERLRKSLPEKVELIALGTNALATAAMLKAGANEGASGPNAIKFMVDRVDLIVGPIGVVIPNSMLGELTAEMANVITSSKPPKLLIPIIKDNLQFVGLGNEPLPHLVQELIKIIEKDYLIYNT